MERKGYIFFCWVRKPLKILQKMFFIKKQRKLFLCQNIDVLTIVVSLTKFRTKKVRKKYLLKPLWQKDKKISFFLSTIQQKKYFYAVDFHAAKTTVVKELISYESIKIAVSAFHIFCSFIQTKIVFYIDFIWKQKQNLNILYSLKYNNPQLFWISLIVNTCVWNETITY